MSHHPACPGQWDHTTAGLAGCDCEWWNTPADAAAHESRTERDRDTGGWTRIAGTWHEDAPTRAELRRDEG